MWIWLGFSYHFYSQSNHFKVFNFQQIHGPWVKKKKHGTLGIKRTYKIVKLPSINWLVFSWQVHSCLVWVQLVRVGFPLKSPQIQTWYSMASVRTSRILNEKLSKSVTTSEELKRFWPENFSRRWPRKSQRKKARQIHLNCRGYLARSSWCGVDWTKPVFHYCLCNFEGWKPIYWLLTANLFYCLLQRR